MKGFGIVAGLLALPLPRWGRTGIGLSAVGAGTPTVFQFPVRPVRSLYQGNGFQRIHPRGPDLELVLPSGFRPGRAGDFSLGAKRAGLGWENHIGGYRPGIVTWPVQAIFTLKYRLRD